MEETVLLSEEKIVSRICFIRGKKVMLDRDLAEMYGSNTAIDVNIRIIQAFTRMREVCCHKKAVSMKRRDQGNFLF